MKRIILIPLLLLSILCNSQTTIWKTRNDSIFIVKVNSPGDSVYTYVPPNLWITYSNIFSLSVFGLDSAKTNLRNEMLSKQDTANKVATKHKLDSATSATAATLAASIAATYAPKNNAVFTGTFSAPNLSGTNTGDNATNTQYSGLAASKLSIPVAGQGTGGTVTQATNKSTGVTLNKQYGRITMNGAALTAGSEVTFILTNSFIAATDVVIVNIQSVGTASAYFVTVGAVGNGTCNITIGNASTGSLSQAIVLNYAIFKSVID